MSEWRKNHAHAQQPPPQTYRDHRTYKARYTGSGDLGDSEDGVSLV